MTNTGRDGQGVTLNLGQAGTPDLGQAGTQGITETTVEGITAKGITQGIPEVSPERTAQGKDIKCFEDLPPDVQETIHKLSTTDGKLDQSVKANRTAIAINYQHLFPDRYSSQTCSEGVA